MKKSRRDEDKRRKESKERVETKKYGKDKNR